MTSKQRELAQLRALTEAKFVAVQSEMSKLQQLEKAIRDQLSAMGHQVVKPAKPVGGSQAIWIDPETGIRTGGSDPRKDGCAIGY